VRFGFFTGKDSLMIRLVVSAAVIAAVSPFAMANDKNACPACGNGVKNPGPTKPTCDHKIYPLSEWHYIKRYCGPVISPNATYGYFQPQWRAWDGGQTAAGCATPQAAAAAPAVELPKVETPKDEPAKPDLMPKPVNPMVVPGKEVAPKPADKGKTGLSPVGALTPPQPVSPGVYLLPTEK
jgi:hypothetical protein